MKFYGNNKGKHRLFGYIVRRRRHYNRLDLDSCPTTNHNKQQSNGTYSTVFRDQERGKLIACANADVEGCGQRALHYDREATYQAGNLYGLYEGKSEKQLNSSKTLHIFYNSCVVTHKLTQFSIKILLIISVLGLYSCVRIPNDPEKAQSLVGAIYKRFPDLLKADTVTTIDTVLLPGSVKDTTIFYRQKDTVVIREKGAVLKYYYHTKDSTVYLSGGCDSTKIIYKDKIIKQKTPPPPMPWHNKLGAWWALIGISVLLLILTIIHINKAK